MRKLVAILAVLFLQLSATSAFAITALFNPNTNTLTMPTLVITNVATFEDVMIKITDFGTIAIDDPAVGNVIEYDPNADKLLLPRVDIDSVIYSRVSLTGLDFSLRNVAGMVDDSFNGYDLDIMITTGERTHRVAHLENVPFPSNREEFCTDDVFDPFQESIEGINGTWSIQGCSFTGTVGSISANLAVAVPISGPVSLTLNWPYSVKFIYTARE